MEEIGLTLKEARESIGLSIEEAASDLKVKPSQIEDIESGKKDSFKDVFTLKYFIRDYSKYLGLNYEDMVDEFNEYLFDYTSKISLDDIKRAKKQLEKKESKENKKNRIASPYTIERKRKISIPTYFIYIIMLIVVVLAGIYLYTLLHEDKPNEDENIVFHVESNRGVLL